MSKEKIRKEKEIVYVIEREYRERCSIEELVRNMIISHINHQESKGEYA